MVVVVAMVATVAAVVLKVVLVPLPLPLLPLPPVVLLMRAKNQRQQKGPGGMMWRVTVTPDPLVKR